MVSTHDLSWRIASACQGGGCIEVAAADGSVAIRATGMPTTTIVVTGEEWRAFVDGMKKGEFDDLV